MGVEGHSCHIFTKNNQEAFSLIFRLYFQSFMVGKCISTHVFQQAGGQGQHTWE